jgi:hypothetical protein
MLVAAIDDSYDGTKTGPEYWAFLVGEDFIIDRNFRLLPDNFEHMTKSLPSKSQKLELLNSFDFSK